MACFAGRNAAYLGDVGDRPTFDAEPAAFWPWATEQALDHGHRDYIFSVHRIKTLRAVQAEVRDGERDRIMLAALARYLVARPKEKHVRRAARQALGFVAREG
jgi:hypothetical protein